MLEMSFTRFMASMAAFKEERVLAPGTVFRWDFVAIAEIGGT